MKKTYKIGERNKRDVKQEFDKIQHTFKIKIVNKQGRQGNFLN